MTPHPRSLSSSRTRVGSCIIGVDTGGTFTDLIYQDGDGWQVFKLLSTPDNPARAVLDGLRSIAGHGPVQVVHGSTVATNAILERKGVCTALITNAGFEDVMAIGRQNRSRLYDLAYVKEQPLVPQELCFGVPGRMIQSGEERTPLDEGRAAEVVREILASGAESVAVCFLFGFANPAHERRMAELLAELGGEAGPPVSLSHEILAEFREFERMSTTVINAYVSPKMHRYLSFLQDHLQAPEAEGGHPESTLRIMQSNGGSISAATAMRESVRTILSGPAGGVVGALAMGRLSGFDRLITFDMGGTSTDVALLNGDLSLTTDAAISGYPVRTPMLDIHTVGAGGGSIAGLDAGGALTVGPESAGADPGPICYGRGERITVTDANLFLGRLLPDYFLGGNMALDVRRIQEPFEVTAQKMRLAPRELAEGVLAVANANMERAIRVISVERGFDPREFTLFSFGGAGGLHAAYLAKLLNMPRVLIPMNPGILSAVGMVMADVIKDYSQTVMREAPGPGPEAGPGTSSRKTRELTDELLGLFAPLESRAVQEMAEEGVSNEDVLLERFLDMRYQGQSFEIITPFDIQADPADAFHELHEKAYGYRNPSKPVEIVTLRLRARGVPKKPVFASIAQGTAQPPADALLDTRPVVFDGQVHDTNIWQRDALLADNHLPGPAVIVEYTSTLLVPPFAEARVDEFGALVLDINS
ncbi:hydantoinase/oxoprolinase family protein [Desulfonatronum thiodismutans]|uniref:hydantoinase/oxoprolinase family protein n=1 Tax=Desulfonatronum thiodismutans TaxID=159290 RepID=UPI0006906302|nr:hydantoinase/oxoprolinase family protein [Desulfonatronum thiodismutans]